MALAPQPGTHRHMVASKTHPAGPAPTRPTAGAWLAVLRKKTLHPSPAWAPHPLKHRGAGPVGGWASEALAGRAEGPNTQAHQMGKCVQSLS